MAVWILVLFALGVAATKAPLFVSANCKEEDKSILQAAASGDATTLEELLKSGGNPNSLFKVLSLNTPKHVSSFSRPLVFDSFQHDFISWTALQIASREGHTEAVRTLLKHGASVEARDSV
jgi:ankyrin repeat protein